MRKSNYQPPILRLMWRMGLRVPPPHFAGFWAVAFVAGAYFALAFSVVLQVITWCLGQPGPMHLLSGSVLAGVFFGLSMGAYYTHGRRQHQLPSWRSLGSES